MFISTWVIYGQELKYKLENIFTFLYFINGKTKTDELNYSGSTHLIVIPRTRNMQCIKLLFLLLLREFSRNMFLQKQKRLLKENILRIMGMSSLNSYLLRACVVWRSKRLISNAWFFIVPWIVGTWCQILLNSCCWLYIGVHHSICVNITHFVSFLCKNNDRECIVKNSNMLTVHLQGISNRLFQVVFLIEWLFHKERRRKGEEEGQLCKTASMPWTGTTKNRQERIIWRNQNRNLGWHFSLTR